MCVHRYMTAEVLVFSLLRMCFEISAGKINHCSHLTAGRQSFPILQMLQRPIRKRKKSRRVR